MQLIQQGLWTDTHVMMGLQSPALFASRGGGLSRIDGADDKLGNEFRLGDCLLLG